MRGRRCVGGRQGNRGGVGSGLGADRVDMRTSACLIVVRKTSEADIPHPVGDNCQSFLFRIRGTRNIPSVSPPIPLNPLLRMQAGINTALSRQPISMGITLQGGGARWPISAGVASSCRRAARRCVGKFYGSGAGQGAGAQAGGMQGETLF